MNATARREDFDQAAHCLREAVEEQDLPASFRALLYLALRQDGRLLAGGELRWPALVLASARAAHGDARVASRVAAAVELFITGLDILDEVEDDDHSPLVDQAGVARALNVSTGLLMLGQRVLSDLAADGVPAARVASFARALTEAGALATGGQHLDLSTEGRADLTPTDALDIARRKGGALVAGACRLGALVGTDDQDLLALYTEYGRHYGTAAQLANDLHDAGDLGRKSDLARSKGTLPLIYDRRSVGSVRPGASPGEAEMVQQLRGGGALHFTWVVLEVERQACAGVLDQLEARGQAVAWLRTLLV